MTTFPRVLPFHENTNFMIVFVGGVNSGEKAQKPFEWLVCGEG